MLLIFASLSGPYLILVRDQPDLAALGIFVWLLVQFTAALHGFRNPLKVLFGMIASFLFIVMILTVILTSLGIVATVPKV